MAAPSAPTRVLVVHEEPTMVLMLRRTLEAASRWDLTGARSGAAAVERLVAEPGRYQGLLLNWTLPDLGALVTLIGIFERNVAPRPWVLGLHGHWGEDELARGMQAGVDGFVTSPLTPEALAAEVDGLQTYGETPTRTRLATLAGNRLQREDEKLWSCFEDPMWRVRMTRLARNLREKAAEGARAEADRMVQRLDGLFGRPIGPEVVRILRAQIERPQAPVEEIARQLGAEGVRVRAYLGVLHEMFATGNPRLPLRSTARAVVAAADAAVEGRSDTEPVSGPEFARLRLLAADVVSQGVSAPVSADARSELCHKMAGLLAVPATTLSTLDAGAVNYVAAGLLQAREQSEAIDRARLAVLQATLNEVPAEGPLDQTRLRALCAALGVSHPPDAGVTARLLQLAGALWPEPGIEEIDAARLAALEQVLRQTPGLEDVDVAALRARLAHLLTALDPGAAVDLQRLAHLVDAWDRRLILRVGLPTVGAIVRILDRGRQDPLLLRFFSIVGAREAASRHRLLDSAVVLRELRPVPLLDTLRMLAILQRVLLENEPPNAARMRAIVQEIDMLQGMARAAEGKPADVPPVPMERVRVEAQLVGLGRLLDMDTAALGLDRAQVEKLAAMFGHIEASEFPGLSSEAVLRLRVLAAVLGRPGRDPVPILRKVLAHCGRDVRTLTTLSVMLSEPAQRPAWEALRAMVGLAPKACISRDVEGHLSNGRVEAAVLGLSDLNDADPRLLGLLNEVALALRTAQRGEEGEPLLLRALRIAPTRLNLLFNYGRLLHEAGRDAEAVAVAERCHRLAPDFGMAETLLRDARARIASAGAATGPGGPTQAHAA